MGFLSDLFGGLTQGAPQMMAGYTGGLVKAQQANLQQDKLEEDRALRRELARMQQADKDARHKTDEEKARATRLFASLKQLDDQLSKPDSISYYESTGQLPQMKKRRSVTRRQLKELDYDIAPFFPDEDDYLLDVDENPASAMGTPSVLQPKLEMPLPPGQLRGAAVPEGMPNPMASLRALLPTDLKVPAADVAEEVSQPPVSLEQKPQFPLSKKTAQGIKESESREGFYGAKSEEIRTLLPERLNQLVADTGLKLSKTETEDLMRDSRYAKILGEIELADARLKTELGKPAKDRAQIRYWEDMVKTAGQRLNEQIRRNQETERQGRDRIGISRRFAKVAEDRLTEYQQQMDPADRLTWELNKSLILDKLQGTGGTESFSFPEIQKEVNDLFGPLATKYKIDISGLTRAFGGAPPSKGGGTSSSVIKSLSPEAQKRVNALINQLSPAQQEAFERVGPDKFTAFMAQPEMKDPKLRARAKAWYHKKTGNRWTGR